MIYNITDFVNTTIGVPLWDPDQNVSQIEGDLLRYNPISDNLEIWMADWQIAAFGYNDSHA